MAQTITINIQAKQDQWRLIDQAAKCLGQTRSDFVIEASCQKAEQVLFDQVFFTLDDKSFQKFETMLDHPPKPTDQLRRLLATKAPWE